MEQTRTKVAIVRGNLSEVPWNYTERDLAVVRQMLEQLFDLLGGLPRKIATASTVVVKPNLVEVPLESTGGSVVTDPRVLEALILLLREAGVRRVIVAEGRSVNLKHVGAGARQAFESLGIATVVRRAGGEVLGWDEEQFVQVDLPDGELFGSVRVPRSLLEADAFITVPKLKTHCQTVITIGIKSMQGVFHVEDKRLYHNEGFAWKMVDMLRAVRPDLTLVDGLIAGEGYGPIYSTPVPLNVLVASEDVVAADAVCSAIMGIDPMEVPITRLAHSEGIGTGDINQVDIVGESLDTVRRTFRRPLEWNPIGLCRQVRVFAGGACRFCLAQIGAALMRLRLEGKLDGLEDICVVVGYNAPVPKKKYQNVYLIGDCARQAPIEGTFVEGCPPLPSIRIARMFEKHLKAGKTSE